MKLYLHSILTALMIFSLLLQGCATAYKGPGPNLSLTGEQAKNEIKNFSFREGFWSQGNWYAMGPDETKYTIESLKPTIEKVSPEAINTLKRAKTFRITELALFGTAIGLLIIAGNTSDFRAQQNLNTLGAFTALGSMVVGIGYFLNLADSCEQYNRDLRKKLSPSVSLNLKY